MLVVPGHESAPVLEFAEVSVNDVAVVIVFGVEVDRPATAGAPALAVGPLVGLLRDHHPYVPGSEVLAVGLGQAGLVPAQRVGGGPTPARAAARNPYLIQQHCQRWGITRIAGRQDQNQRQPTAGDQRMGLGRRAAAETPDGVTVRFVPATQQFLVI